MNRSKIIAPLFISAFSLSGASCLSVVAGLIPSTCYAASLIWEIIMEFLKGSLIMISVSIVIIILFSRFYKKNPGYDLSGKRLKFYAINIILIVFNLCVLSIAAILSGHIMLSALCCIVFSLIINFMTRKGYKVLISH